MRDDKKVCLGNDEDDVGYFKGNDLSTIVFRS